MKTKLALPFLSVLIISGHAHAEDLLTGDTRLACETILCLSSGKRPEECDPAIKRFYSIQKKKWKDTLKARKNFLELCPQSKEDDNMKSLTAAIAEGAGRCDADTLNQTLARQVERKVCMTSNYSRDDPESCYIETITVIDNQKPAYCAAYEGHGYTYQLGATYVGEPMNGGRWR